ncbi:MAG: hypothetical protein M1820_010269 [Bogoriella megaspora]|nr:MAG: hypothetical protein M1820_010269 [Bogoriella megaspora]
MSAFAPGRHAKPEKVPELLDEAVLTAFPSNSQILSIKPSGTSAWVQTVRIDVRNEDGFTKAYFMKSEKGNEGKRLMEGSFESEKIFNEYAPNHVPKPIAWGSYKSDPDTWFLLSDFVEMVEDVPDVKDLVSIIAKIHRDSAGKSPEGKFGFHVPTHLGYIPNNNLWQTSWEAWFTNAMLRIFEEEERSHGNDDTQQELEILKKSLFNKVIPRLLRPLESYGRTVVPCLIHSDLWLGNIQLNVNTEDIVIFDSCAYWGHNESDLGVWKAPRYRLGQPYLKEYQKQMGLSAPKEDWDDRNTLYSIRYDLLHSAMFPKETEFRATAMSEMKRLIAKFPRGLDDYGHAT